MHSLLHTQTLVPAPLETKIRLTFLSIALVDALGGPVENKDRFTFPFHTRMLYNESLCVPEGCWTDDTSMTLCLATSIANNPTQFNEIDQLKIYANWYQEGYMSPISAGGFGCGKITGQALDVYLNMSSQETRWILEEITERLNQDWNAGNLMRLAPVPLVYWKLGDEKVKEYARRSSTVTHPTALCLEVCEMWAMLLANVVRRSQTGNRWTKLDVIHWVAHYPYVHPTLVDSLLPLPHGIPSVPEEVVQRESFYRQHHQLLTIPTSSTAERPLSLPSEVDLPSSGYVLHTVQAALFSFFASSSFEEGALIAVNLGGDADTVGAIYAALAGLWYGSDDAENSIFWTENVLEWQSQTVKLDLVNQVAKDLHNSVSK
ncbi:ADP-ribosylation/Crystallin J1 [Flagelloscypha sp. PMI_526]|nr:ADP-ribosylation/Crystallin J1 [Flagelloscypha sp. PMI_526]